jgi:hypothetical protein
LKICPDETAKASRHFGTNLLSAKCVDHLALVEERVALGAQEDRVSGSSRHALSQVSSFVCWTMRVAASNVLSQLDDRLL